LLPELTRCWRGRQRFLLDHVEPRRFRPNREHLGPRVHRALRQRQVIDYGLYHPAQTASTVNLDVGRLTDSEAYRRRNHVLLGEIEHVLTERRLANLHGPK